MEHGVGDGLGHQFPNGGAQPLRVHAGPFKGTRKIITNGKRTGKGKAAKP